MSLITRLSPLTLALLTAVGAQAAPQQSRPEPKAAGLIVKFKDGQRSAAAVQAAVQGQRALVEGRGLAVAFEREGALGQRVIRLQRRASVAELKQLARQIQDADPSIAYVEPDYIVRPSFIPNDSAWANQWDMSDPVGGIKAPQAWDLAQGFGQRVAVLDTGVLAHADLAANLLPGYDFISDSDRSQDGNGRDSNAADPGDWEPEDECGWGEPATNSSWHGTHVAGTIAAIGNNALGISGVAPKAKIVPVRVLGRCGGAISDIADGIVWAAGGTVSGVPANPYPARILNLSLGGDHSCSSTEQEAIDKARKLGALVVVAAGNDNIDVADYSPAGCRGVTAVGATNRLGGKSAYSNWGAGVDLSAPGGDAANGNVLSLSNSGSMGPVADNLRGMRGTSMAAPHVAGTAALMLSINSLLPAVLADNLMVETARAFPVACSNCGAGILDAQAALIAARGYRPEREPNDSLGAAHYLNVFPARVDGFLDGGNLNDLDIYSVYVPARNRLQARLWHTGLDFSYSMAFEVLDVNGKVLKTSSKILNAQEANIWNGASSGQTFYLRVKGQRSGLGGSFDTKVYRLQLDRNPY